MMVMDYTAKEREMGIGRNYIWVTVLLGLFATDAFGQIVLPPCPSGEIPIENLKSKYIQMYAYDCFDLDSNRCLSEYEIGMVSVYDSRNLENRELCPDRFYVSCTDCDEKYINEKFGSQVRDAGRMEGHAMTTVADLGLFPNLVMIAESSFESHKLIQKVELSNIEVVGRRAFKKSGVESVSLPNARSIGEEAFAGTANLKSLSLPNVKAIGETAFEFSSNLKAVDLPSAEIIGRRAFRRSGVESVSLPKARFIGDIAFKETPNLKTVSLPKAETIGANAFGASGLEKVSLPSARVIGDKAFSGGKLKSLELTSPEEILLGNEIVDNASEIALVLNKNKSPKGASSPKATDKKHWGGYEWKSISYK